MIALLGLALAASPQEIDEVRGRVDWDAAGAETARVLSDYLAVDTVNAPGNELRGVQFLGGLLDREGIPWEASGIAPGRAVLVGRLEGSGDEPPLCLLHHIDVVPFERERWSVDPLSGHIDPNGVVWGRGALDMKGQGVLHLMALVWLKRLEVPLERDVVLLAVPDEEVDNEGMIAAVQDLWPTIGCSHLINEGGLALDGAVLEGQQTHGISVAEKGVLWLRVVAEGPAGHGSTLDADEALVRLRHAIDRIEAIESKPRLDPSMYQLLAASGRKKGGLVGAILRSPALVDMLVRPRLARDLTTRSILVDTIHLTGMQADGGGVNVVPGTATATFDIRLRPTTSPDVMLARVEAAVAGVEGVHVEVVSAQPSMYSPTDDPLYEAIERWATAHADNAVAGPVLSPGFTDSMFARQIGVRAYGYAPLVLTLDEVRTMHGHDERVSTDALRDGVRTMLAIVLDFAGLP